jgi:hypothetical protein
MDEMNQKKIEMVEAEIQKRLIKSANYFSGKLT